MGVVDGLFYHLDNGDIKLFRYPISILVGKEDRTPNEANLNYFIHLLKIFVIKSKLQNEWDQRKRRYKHINIDIWCFCVGKDNCKKLKWEQICEDLCPYIDCGRSWARSQRGSE